MYDDQELNQVSCFAKLHQDYVKQYHLGQLLKCQSVHLAIRMVTTNWTDYPPMKPRGGILTPVFTGARNILLEQRSSPRNPLLPMLLDSVASILLWIAEGKFRVSQHSHTDL